VLETAFGNEASRATAAQEQQADRAAAQETAAHEHALRDTVDDASIGHAFRAHVSSLPRVGVGRDSQDQSADGNGQSRHAAELLREDAATSATWSSGAPATLCGAR